MSQKPSTQIQPTRIPAKKISRDALILCCVDFPIYYIESINERHIVIAGGGGSANTGVHNQVNILELVPTNESCAAELVTRYQTPKEIPDAIMTGSLLNDGRTTHIRLVTGGSNNTTVYKFNFEVDRRCYVASGYEVLRSTLVKAEIKCVKCSMDGRIFTGSFDGDLTVWDNDRVEKSFRKHSKAIDEIDIDQKSRLVVTLSREESKFMLWNLDNCEPIKTFGKEVLAGSKHNFRSCRFACDKTNSESPNSYLLVVCNSSPPGGPSLIYKLTTKEPDYKAISCKPIQLGGIMSMEISGDGRYIAIGTNTGCVAMLDVRSMNSVYKLDNAHHIAVTGLEFLPSKSESMVLSNSQLNPFLSVSMDRRVVLHRPGRRSLLLQLLKLLSLALFLFIAFVYTYNYYVSETSLTINNDTSSAQEQEHYRSINISS